MNIYDVQIQFLVYYFSFFLVFFFILFVLDDYVENRNRVKNLGVDVFRYYKEGRKFALMEIRPSGWTRYLYFNPEKEKVFGYKDVKTKSYCFNKKNILYSFCLNKNSKGVIIFED